MTLSLIFKDRRFWPLFWTQFLGALNDNFFKNALVILVQYKSVSLFGMESAGLVAAAGGIFIFPFFLFSATAGQIADKYDKATVVKITKFTELFFMLCASAAFFMNSYLALFIVLFLMGTQSAFFGPLKYGIIPNLVEKTELVSANAAVSMGTFISILIGTILGGYSTHFEEYQYFISGGVIFFALCGIASSLFINKVGNRDEKIKVDITILKPTWDILKLTAKNTHVFKTVIGISWFWFLGAALLSVIPTLVEEVFQGDESVATLFLAMFTIGMGFGSFLVEKISYEKAEIGLVPIATIFMSLFIFDLAWVGANWEVNSLVPLTPEQFLGFTQGKRALFDLFMITVFGGCYIVPQYTRVQELSDVKELSRTIAGNNIWNALFMVTAAVAIMLLASLGIPKVMLILGTINAAVSFYLYAIYSEDTLKVWMSFISRFFYKTEVIGRENLPKDGPIIVCSNHVSFLDWVFVTHAVKRPVRYIIDYNYYYVTWGPFWFKQAKLVPIATKKEDPEVLEKAFENISDHIREGATLGIFPEGWISRDGKLRKFQPGIQKIITRDPIPVVPVIVEGLWGSIFSFSGGRVLLKFPRSLRRKVKVTIHKPISPEDFKLKELEALFHSTLGSYEEFQAREESENNESGATT